MRRPLRGVSSVGRFTGDGLGQDLGDDVVAALRDRDRQSGGGRFVHLGRAAPAPRLVGGCLGPGLQQAGVDELVQVERGQPAGHADGLTRLLPAHRVVGVAHVLVQGPPRAVGQRDDGGPAIDHLI